MFFNLLILYFVIIANGYIFNSIDKPKGWSSINVGLDPINDKKKPKHKDSSISYILLVTINEMGKLNPNHCLSLTKQGSLHHDNGISMLEPHNILGPYYERTLFSTSPLWSIPCSKSFTIFSNFLNLNHSSSLEDPTIWNLYAISAMSNVYSFENIWIISATSPQYTL